jgi:hypothetical protein
VTIISFVIGAAIVFAVKTANPLIQLPPVWRMLLAIPTFYVYVFAMLFVHLIIPSHVEVRSDRMHVMTGQSHWFVKAEAVRRTRIVVFAVDRVRLHVFYSYKDKLRSKTIAVGEKVDLGVLATTLPKYPQIWDARKRYSGSSGKIDANVG